MLFIEAQKVVAEKIKSTKDECLFPEAVEDFLECEYFKDCKCNLANRLDCILLDDDDKNEIGEMLGEKK